MRRTPFAAQSGELRLDGSPRKAAERQWNAWGSYLPPEPSTGLGDLSAHNVPAIVGNHICD